MKNTQTIKQFNSPTGDYYPRMEKEVVTDERTAARETAQWWNGKISESDVNRIASYLEQSGIEASNRNIAFQHCKETLADFKDQTTIAFYNLLDAAIGF